MRRSLSLGVTVLVLMSIAQPARATFPGANGVIAIALDGITLINPDGTDQHVIASKGGNPAWTADGNVVLFAYRGSIYSVNSDGSQLTKETRPPGQANDSEPAPLPPGGLTSRATGATVCAATSTSGRNSQVNRLGASPRHPTRTIFLPWPPMDSALPSSATTFPVATPVFRTASWS